MEQYPRGRRDWFAKPARGNTLREFESHLLRADNEVMDGLERELILLRTKLEIRSWILRFSLALNAGLIVWIISR